MAAAPARSSIVTKLTRSFVFVVFASVLLVCLCFIGYGALQYRDTVAERIAAAGSIVASNSAGALAFNDAESAHDLVQGLAESPHILSACIFTADGSVLGEYVQAGEAECSKLPRGTPMWSWTLRSGRLRYYRELDFDGSFMGSLVIVRSLSDFRAAVLRLVLVASGVLLLVTLASMLLARPMQSFLTNPILHLAEIARHVTSEQEYSRRATKSSEDELGHLTDAFNEMLEQIQRRDQALADHRTNLEAKIAERTSELRRINESVITTNARLKAEIAERKLAELEREKLNKQLVKASREAGMAEIATGVLHNVGNVLNSVGVSLSYMDDKLRNPRAAGIQRLLSIVEGRDLARFVAEDDRSVHFLPYLEKLAESIESDHGAFLEEFGRLYNNFEHVKRIVSMQQNYARSTALAETVNPEDLIEDAIAVNRASLSRGDITIIREFGEVDAASLDRHKVLQILVNLIRNAAQAMIGVECMKPTLTLRLAVQNGDRIQIEVEDNGCGIEAENITRIFRHGFTTKADGHGYGLHSSATTAQELHGSLRVESDGPGTGATFTLELPTLG